MLSNTERTQGGRQGLLYVLTSILVFGSLWGLSEVVLGGSLRAAGFPYRSGLLTGAGMGIMGVALAMSRKWLLPVGIGVVAALVTLLVVPIMHVSVMCKANSCLALGLESGSLSLAAVLVGRKASRNIYGRMGMGGGAALLASAAFYFIGRQVAPCAYLLSFTTPGSFIVTEGLVWAAFSAILLPLGYAVGELLVITPLPVLFERNLARYASSAAIVALCWGISASAIAAGF